MNPPFLSLLLLSCLLALSAAEEKPNIVVIFTDDHGWPDIGAAGIYADLKTPHIDALAASGVRATNGYATAPQCVPSRAGLLSGRYQNRFGVESNAEKLDGFDAQTTIAARLKTVGYATGQIGKWHLGPAQKTDTHGFDDVYGKNSNRPCFANFTLDGRTIPMQQVDDGLYHLDACSQAALAFVRRHEKQPFFLYLAYRAPHVPLDAPPKYLSRFPGEMPERRRQALAMMSAVDDGIGALTADLQERGLREKTLIFLIGDNGAPLKIHKADDPGGGPGWDGSLNEPMNGEKGMLAEGGIRVPFVIAWPGTIPSAKSYDQPVISLDVAATAAAAAGLSDTAQLDGVNLVPYLTGERDGPPHDFLMWRWISQAAIREGRWKLLRGGDREYLFDLDADPGEQTNLRAQNAEIAGRLRARLTQWSAELQPPGLATHPMADVWNLYFDHYFDGKTAARMKPPDWIARNAALDVRDGTLHVTPTAGAQPPFLVRSGIRLRGAFTVRLQLKNAADGTVGVAWRRSDQKDFSPEQLVRVPFSGADAWQDVEIFAPADGDTIHLRILLPNGPSEVRAITLENQ